MRIAYCTILTIDYLHYALALNESLLAHDPSLQLKVLVSDVKSDLSAISARYPNIKFYFIDQLCQDSAAKHIYEKYSNTDMDCLRWSMKPVFINFLLDQAYDQVFFLDSDLYFFAPFSFLSDHLQDRSVLLTPHWRTSNPYLDENNFSILLTSGLYNAGFIGVSQLGRPAMKWWAGVCAHECRKAPDKGLFVDQGYLNLLPIYFDNVAIEKHRGCNVANWNQVECRREFSGEGEVKIDGEFEIVFIHFTNSTIKGITSGKDYLLKPYLEKYQKSLSRHKKWVSHSTNITSKNSNPSKTKIINKRLPVKSQSPSNDRFLKPRFCVDNIDRYFIRKSILDALRARLGEFQGRLLDVGCGQKPYRTLLTSHPSRVTEYIGLDLDNNPIHDNQPDITWINGSIPLEDGSIDCAIATEVFEHCPDPEAVMYEINRVLKPGGVLFYTVPFLWPLHEVPHDEYRYTPFSLKRHLAQSGFTAIDLRPLGGWDASLAQMLGLWLRRRPLGKRIRWLLSSLMMPLVYLLSQRDKRAATPIQSSTMITGISGTAIKAGNRNFMGD